MWILCVWFLVRPLRALTRGSVGHRSDDVLGPPLDARIVMEDDSEADDDEDERGVSLSAAATASDGSLLATSGGGKDMESEGWVPRPVGRREAARRSRIKRVT